MDSTPCQHCNYQRRYLLAEIALAKARVDEAFTGIAFYVLCIIGWLFFFDIYPTKDAWAIIGIVSIAVAGTLIVYNSLSMVSGHLKQRAIRQELNRQSVAELDRCR